MPDIAILYVTRHPGDPDTYDVDSVTGEAIVTDAEDFGVTGLADLAQAEGVTRWSEATDEDRQAYDAISYVAERLILVGWAEAPIARDDVEQHSEMSREPHPAVNVKVYDSHLPKGAAWTALVDEFRDGLDSRLARLSDDELRDLVEQYLEKDETNTIFNVVCEDHFEQASDDATGNIFPDHNIKVWSEGRSGGWLVVHGLPDVAHWDAKLLTQWHALTESCKALVADIPRAMAWVVLANCQDDLAGRVIRVELSMILTDRDLEEAGESPEEWDWRGMLDLQPESTLTARKLD